MLSNQKNDPIAKITARKVMVPSIAWDINDFTNFILYSFAINRVSFNEHQLRL